MDGLLNDCYRIEQLAGEIYHRLAIDQGYAPEIRGVFHALGSDERAHARQIDMVRQTAGRELNAIGRIAWESVDVALQQAERMAAELDRRRLDEVEALRLAVEMEQAFVKVHVNNALHFRNPRVAALFEELGSQDQLHLDRLRECLKWWHRERKPLLKKDDARP